MTLLPRKSWYLVRGSRLFHYFDDYYSKCGRWKRTDAVVFAGNLTKKNTCQGCAQQVHLVVYWDEEQ